MKLVERRCAPCEGGTKPLGTKAAGALLAKVPDWSMEGNAIARSWRMKDFQSCVSFLRDIADLAEDEGHHPDLLIHRYRNLKATLSTHAIGGLSDNDFILAAKIDRLWSNTNG